MINSIMEINLTPDPNKVYWKNCHREWREDFIYFLLVDRFHDDKERQYIKNTSQRGFGKKEELADFYGGTINGITKHLDYIKGLGCTALWLSPIFETSEKTYHGYAVENYLTIDKRFGTKDDLKILVQEAHSKDIRVFLDIVLNHSADTWFYPNNDRYFYYQGIRFPFGGWRKEDRPIPVELRNPEFYSRKGEIRNWDSFPETIDGDFFEFKNFLNDESENGLKLQDILIKIHCYWIKELDIDGFRMDAVKHMSEIAVARFCSEIREFAYLLGKRNFFLFGELAGGDEACNHYIGPKTTLSSTNNNTIYYGLNSVLDFPLYYVLGNVIKGLASPAELITRYEILRKNSFFRGEFGEFLVTFIDNHDQVGGSYKKRFGFEADPKQIVAGIGFLLCSIGTPCIYYGTEQGFNGHGEDDSFIREAMFSKVEDVNCLDHTNFIYKEISKIAHIRNTSSVLKFGKMFIRDIADEDIDFKPPHCNLCLIAFSRVLSNEEIVIAYNTSISESRTAKIKIENPGNKKSLSFLYGNIGELEIGNITTNCESISFITVILDPMQFVVLT